MTRKYWLKLGPNLLVGLGIIVATLAAKLAADSGWWVMAGPALLALSVVCADLFEARLRRERSMPSFGALVLAGTFVAMGVVVTLRDPGLVKLLIPVVGTTCWVAVLSRSDEDRRSCRYI
ncbi:MAG TPA: hypothetical protein VFP92_07845 [Rhodanobacteraceae bacterium]|nr:hypothetical protein [Rhodanobacteraceae bacterium]